MTSIGLSFVLSKCIFFDSLLRMNVGISRSCSSFMTCPIPWYTYAFSVPCPENLNGRGCLSLVLVNIFSNLGGNPNPRTDLSIILASFMSFPSSSKTTSINSSV